MGFRYRFTGNAYRDVQILVFRRLHKVIFVHGCFWHRHPLNCKLARLPGSRINFPQKNWERTVNGISERAGTFHSRLESDGCLDAVTAQGTIREQAEAIFREGPCGHGAFCRNWGSASDKQAAFNDAKVVERDRWCCDTIRENRARGTSAIANWPTATESDVRGIGFREYEGRWNSSLAGRHASHFH